MRPEDRPWWLRIAHVIDPRAFDQYPALALIERRRQTELQIVAETRAREICRLVNLDPDVVPQ